MKNVFISFLFFLLLTNIAQAQCPSGDVDFTTQQQVDDFAIQYPNCTELSGTIMISGSDIFDLRAFSNLTIIEGSLLILNCPMLTHTTGFHNLTNVNGGINISNNSSLVDITDFGGGFEVAGLFTLSHNSQLNNCYLRSTCGFGNGPGISFNGEDCYYGGQIFYDCEFDNNCVDNYVGNLVFTSQAKLNSFFPRCEKLIGDIIISGDDIVDLSILSEITTITGGLIIQDNPLLTNLTPLNDLAFGALTNLTIQNNPQLTTCDMTSLCRYIAEGGSATITNNAPGCTSVSEIATACDGNNDCPPNVHFYSQADINNFASSYPNCTEIQGDMYFSLHSYDFNTDITDLSPLTQLTAVHGNLNVIGNPLLTSLNGLQNITQVGKGVFIRYNDNLSDISSLGNIQSIVKALNVNDNPTLSICDLPFICNFALTDNTTEYIIDDNAPGCNSYTEAVANCITTCYTGDVTLITQQQVNNFAAAYGSDCFEGTLQIGSTSGGLTDIDDLTPLSQVAYVDNLSIQRTNITDLSGLEQIHVDNDITIVLNPNLTNLDALNCITEIDGQLHIGYNKDLATLNGLNQLTSASSIRINNNNKLTSLLSLHNLVEVSELTIQNNPVLTALEGLGTVNYLTLSNLTITSNASLSTCAYANICEYVLSLGGANLILNNAPGCANEADIFAACNVYGTCYIGDVQLETQQEVNDFATTYSGCPEIGGRLRIEGNITDISPLSFLTSIDELLIQQTELTSLTGLEQLQHVGNLSISRNDNLNDMTGLNNLTEVSGRLYIYYNSMATLEGLNQLTSVGELAIRSNNLTSLSALSNLQNVSVIELWYTSTLSSLEGLENIDPNSLTYIYMLYNNDLNMCSLPNICEYLSNGGLNYINNSSTAIGCRDFAEIEAGCGGAACPPGDVVLQTQQQVNDFATTYPNCANIEGMLYIGKTSGSLTDINDLSPLNQIEAVDGISIQRTNITDLSGLEQLQIISGDLRIVLNPNLMNINTLNDITSIDGQVHIGYNKELLALTGLNQLNSVGSLRINNNNKLANLSALMNLETAPEIIIQNNQILSSLSGLEGLNVAQMNNLIMTSNPLLATCSLENICEYLGQGGANIIANNAAGCTTAAEIQAPCDAASACELGTVYLFTQQQVNDFAVMHGNCDVINGNIYIGTDSGNLTNITDLSPLSFITSVTGTLSIQRTRITDLSGLENLQNVDNNFEIILNPYLLNLNALSNLNSVGIDLAITYNRELVTLEGLEGLTNVIEIFIKSNKKLTSLEALSNLMTVKVITIQQNEALTTLAGLDNFDPAELNAIAISSNPVLSMCNTPAICAALTQVPVEKIYINAAGCSNDQEVLATCTSSPPSDSCNTAPIISTETFVFDNDLFIDGVGFDNNPKITFTDPATPTNAVLSDITLQLFFRVNGTSCEHEIDVQVTDPAGNVNVFSGIFASCNGMAGGLYSTTINIPSASTTGSMDDWLIEFDDTNDQNTDYEYSLRFARLIYTTTTISEGEIVMNQVSEFADYDLYIDGVGFANNDTYTFVDPGTPADAILSDISLELYFKLNGNSCENEIAIQITDPAGNTQPLTAFTTCVGGTDLYFVNLNVPSGNTTGNVADWVVEFNDTNDQNADYEYSVRFGRLTYNTEYIDCMEMLTNEGNTSTHQYASTSVQKNASTSAHQHISTLKLYPVPASNLLNVEYHSENAHSTDIEIISNEGKTLMSKTEFLQEGLNTIQLDITNIPVGYYFIRMYGADDIQTQPFVKITP